MAEYDGIRVPVTQLLGVGFKTRFLTRFCIPLFDDDAPGFDSAPGSQYVPGTSVLRGSPDSTVRREPTRRVSNSYGVYRVKYVLTAQVAVHPDAFTRPVTDDGPYDIQNIWTTKSFHHSIL